MLGYYNCTALADLLGNSDQLLETVEEAVRLLTRAAEASDAADLTAQQKALLGSRVSHLDERHKQQPAPLEREQALLPSSEPHQPSRDTRTDRQAHKTNGNLSEAEVEKIACEHLFEQADWPESYAEEDRRRLRDAVRREMSGESGLWIADAILQVCHKSGCG